MAFSSEEIKANLSAFVDKWAKRQGYEKGEGQTFQNDFFACFSPDLTDQLLFEKHKTDVGFMDGLIPGLVIVEMKSASEAKKLEQHRQQVFDYWKGYSDAATGQAAARFLILCAFTKFEIWEPGRYPSQPRIVLDLEELPANFDSFAFLLGNEPIFGANKEQVSIEAATELGKLLQSLEDREESTPRVRRNFLLQSVWCMFAEDTGQIDQLGFTRILDGLIADPNRASEDDLGGLFTKLADDSKGRPVHGIYKGVPYVNGSLFEDPAFIHLEPDELKVLRGACNFDWSMISPAVFGSLMQTVFGPERQQRLGAHYTPEKEIMLAVEPTILDPWTERIEKLSSFDEAVAALEDLHEYKVLDPACGCGNFLSISYRELRSLEANLIRRIEDFAKQEGRGEWKPGKDRFPLRNMMGIEVESFAVDLARLSLWMAQWISGKELDLHEKTLPLTDLSGIRRSNALVIDWPEANAIVGNPPYHGSQNLRENLATEEIEFLRNQFGVGLKDYCVYWFRKAADSMRPGDRAGLVGTNSISQNRARGASLNYVIEKGGVITNAVSMHEWPGVAVVNVSIVSWIMKPDEDPGHFLLDGHEVAGINTRLQESVVPIEEYERLAKNKGRSFQGPIPAGPFDLTIEEGLELLDDRSAEYEKVIRPYLVGDDIARDPSQNPSRYVIDFNDLPLEKTNEYPRAIKLVRERVKPVRDESNDANFRKYWWRFGRRRGEMRTAISDYGRFVTSNRIGKRFNFCWTDQGVCPSDLTIVFAFDDDYSMGVLMSAIHRAWAHSEGSTLRVDLRYTPTSCFETFPWPDRDPKHIEEIGSLSAELLGIRSSICEKKQIGLTTLYNQVDEGAWEDLAKAHKKLDEAVAKAYGWPAKVAHDPLEIKKRLAERHARIIEGKIEYEPFA